MKNVQINIKIDTGNGVKTLDNLKVGFEEVYGEIRPLTTQLGELEDILYQMAAAGQSGTDAFKAIQKEVANSKKIVQETDKVIDAMSQTLGSKLGLAASGVAGAFGAAQGAIAIFGVESDAVAQTLVKLQSAMAIQQGLASFKESIPVIKQFGASVAAAVTSYFGLTAAKEADAVATGVATTATKGLSIAMKSIPIVAIVAGIAALATALYSYFKNSEEAEKAEKKRAEAAKKAKEAADAQRASIAQESVAFVGLIYQLKESNANSKERAALIKQINAQYGTTLKNLSDETAFQNQLNVAVKEYIAYQTLKVRIQSQEEYMTKLIQKRIKAENEHSKILKNLTDGYTKVAGSDYEYRSNVDGTIKTLAQLRDAFSIYGDELTEQERIMYDVDDALSAAGLSTLKLKGKIDEITNSGKKYVEQTQKQTTATNEFADALKALIEKVIDLNEQDVAEKAKSELEKLRLAKSTAENELKLLYDTANAKAKNDTERLKASEQYAEGLRLIDEDYARDVKALEDEMIQTNKEFEDERLANHEEYLKGVEDADNAATAKSISDAEKEFQFYLENEERKANGRLKKQKEYLELEKANRLTGVKEGSEEEAAVLAEYRQKEIDATVAHVSQISQMIGGVATQITDMIQQSFDAAAERENQRISDSFDKSSEELKNNLANRLITQEEYDAKLQELQNKRDAQELKAKKKAFEQSKKIAIINATIQTATAVLSAFSSGAAYPFVGPATGAIFAGIAAALGAVQIGVIASQKFQAARGGVVPNNGGPSNIDSVDALLAPNEMVINANSARMFPQLLSEINQAGGGVSLAPDTAFVSRANNNQNTFSQGGNGNNQPTRAYIVYNDLKTGSDKGERLSNRGTFGR